MTLYNLLEDVLTNSHQIISIDVKLLKLTRNQLIQTPFRKPFDSMDFGELIKGKDAIVLEIGGNVIHQKLFNFLYFKEHDDLNNLHSLTVPCQAQWKAV